jgi:hypothetical protein
VDDSVNAIHDRTDRVIVGEDGRDVLVASRFRLRGAVVQAEIVAVFQTFDQARTDAATGAGDQYLAAGLVSHGHSSCQFTLPRG